MDIKLVVNKGRKPFRTLHLSASQTVFGRGRGCKVRIPCAEVSRRHALLTASDGIVTIEDLKSKNGTWLNEMPVSGRQPVRPGDRLRIGPFTFVVEYQLSPSVLNRMLEQEESCDEIEVVEQEEADVSDVDKPLPVDPELALDSGAVPVRSGEDRAAAEAEPEEEAVQDQPAESLGDWELPETENLRHLLSELDDQSPEQPRSRRQKQPSRRHDTTGAPSPPKPTVPEKKEKD